MPHIYDFEWDARKAFSNMKKHGVSFEQAAQVFLDPLSITVFDEAHSMKEERWLTLGQNTNGDLLVVAHTYLQAESNRSLVRIISARLATKQERRIYSESPI
ncbi:BrnT family toxin [Methyloglobulus sp.]|uniref:BrnT family toxin n=1 Tax=Methyloglobulus sp. TaxID=2518622 RepID=UPI0032B7B247